jgi:hypothetical protein
MVTGPYYRTEGTLGRYASFSCINKDSVMFNVRSTHMSALAGVVAIAALTGPALSAPIAPSALPMESSILRVQMQGDDQWVPRRGMRQQPGGDRSDRRRFDDGNENVERRGMSARRGDRRDYSERRRYDGGRQFVYDQRRYGPRYSYRHGSYRHYHDGYYYASPWWLGAGVGAIVGSAVANSQEYGDEHIEWCASQYRTYDPRTNTFIGRGGRRYVCVIQ